MGNEENRAATLSKSAERFRCCHKGVRMPGRRLGSNRARLAASRNFAAKREVLPNCRSTNSLNSAGEGNKSSVRIVSSLSGTRKTNPSFDHIDSTSSPRSARIFEVTAMHHGACTALPKGVRTHTRRSPISSRQVSITTSSSLGIRPVATT